MILCPLPQGSYRITQRFGANPASYARFGLRGHNGIDLAPLRPGTRGVVVHAPHDGYARLKDDGKDGYGRHVALQSLPTNNSGEGRLSTLAHLERFLVEDGQFVRMGDPVGIMGSTGFSTGIHLHWTYKVTLGGRVLNLRNGYGGAIDVSPYVRVWLDLPFSP